MYCIVCMLTRLLFFKMYTLASNCIYLSRFVAANSTGTGNMGGGMGMSNTGVSMPPLGGVNGPGGGGVGGGPSGVGADVNSGGLGMGMGAGGSGPAPQMSISGLPMTMDVNEFPALANRMGGMNLQGNMDGTMPGGSGVARYHNALHGTAGSRTPRSCTPGCHALVCPTIHPSVPHRMSPCGESCSAFRSSILNVPFMRQFPAFGSSNTRTPPVEHDCV